MTSNRRLEVTEEAESDIREIIQYGSETWGPERAHDYADRLDTAMRRLITYPSLGRTRDDMASGLRAHPTGEHVIYYRVDEQTVTITRVLHRRIDAAGQLEGAR